MKSKLFALFCCLHFALFIPVLLVGQTTPPQTASLIQAELTKRGLSQAEATAALAEIGIDPLTVTPELLLARQSEITRVLDDLAIKKAGGVATPDVGPTVVDEKASTVSEKVVEAAAENAAKVAVKSEEPTSIYGHAIFTDQSLEVFRTTEGAKAPETYILGAGDRVRVTIFGVSQADLLLEINNEGYVQPTGMAQIYLQGVSLADARRLLRQRLGQAYRFQNDQFSVSIQTARTVQVNVFGETKLRGTFTLSALNSAFGALMAAGGPNELGSVRQIELIRGRNRRKLDVYEFMNNPGIAYDWDIQQNDIIFVPVARFIVSVEGAVKRPMRYELTGKEGLKELINLAGGLNFNTYSEQIQIERIQSDSASLLEFRLGDVMSGKIKVELRDGDVIRVRESKKILESYSTIEGAVFYPGKYALVEGVKLREILVKAQLKPEALTESIIIERIGRDGTVKLIKITEAEIDSFTLDFRDRITVYEKELFTNQGSLSVVGAVRQPFERKLEFGDKLTLGSVLLAAGGVLPTADELAYIKRQDLRNPDLVSYIKVNLDRDSEFVLKAGDQLNIYDKTIFSLAKSLKITGSVNQPSTFTFNETLTVADLILMAGGLKLASARNRVDIFRLKYNNLKGTGYEKITVEIDSNLQLVGSNSKLKLAPFDIIVVRDLPLFDLNRSVQVSGQVYYPGTYPLEPNRVHFSQLLKKAGGLNVLADVEHAVIIRLTGNKGQIGFNPRKAILNEGNEKHDPILLPGDVIEIAILQNTVGIRLRATREADLFNAGVVLGNTNENQVRYFTYRGKKSAKWYLRNLAGGFGENADRSSVTVLYPDGSVVGTKRHLGVFRDYPTLKPGSIVSLTYKVPKPATEKKKIDVDVLYTRTLTSVTTILTLVILARQL